MNYLLILIPILFITIATFLIYSGLAKNQAASGGIIAMGISMLVFILAETIVLEIFGLGPIALLQLVPTSIAAIIAGVWLARKLPKWKTSTGIFLSLGYIGLLIICFAFGLQYTPDAVISRNGQELVKSLKAYHSATGKYPAALDELVPVYISDLHQPKTVWGWLYRTSNDDFTLGYVFDVDKLGYSVCVMHSISTKWVCILNSTGPFNLAPTPTP